MSQDVVTLDEQEALRLIERYHQILEKEARVGISPQERAELACLEAIMNGPDIRVPIA